jgi:ABC-2 type transport system permease protein
MSTATVAEASIDTVELPLTPHVRTSQKAVIVSEWTKFRSLRSTIYTLAASVILLIGIGAISTAVTAAKWSGMSFIQQATFRPILTSLQGGLFAQLTIGVLGVMMMTSEYSTGMIRSTFTVVPRRLPVLWAKLVVFVTTIGIATIISTVVAFFLGQALLSRVGIGVSISTGHALRDVIGEALYLTLAGVIGIAIGALLRSTAGGITTFIAGIFVLPPVLDLLPTDWTNHIAPYLPAAAGQALWSGNPDATSSQLSPWVGFAVMGIWAVVLIAAAVVRITRSDA